MLHTPTLRVSTQPAYIARGCVHPQFTLSHANVTETPAGSVNRCRKSLVYKELYLQTGFGAGWHGWVGLESRKWISRPQESMRTIYCSTVLAQSSRAGDRRRATSFFFLLFTCSTAHLLCASRVLLLTGQWPATRHAAEGRRPLPESVNRGAYSELPAIVSPYVKSRLRHLPTTQAIYRPVNSHTGRQNRLKRTLHHVF